MAGLITGTVRWLLRVGGLLGLACLLGARGLAGQSGAVVGRVVDAAGGGVADARVQLVERGRLVLGGADGTFRMESVAPGRHTLLVTRIGFSPASRVIEVAPAATLEVRVELAPATVELAPLQVTATALPTSAIDAPQAVATIDSADLRTARAPSLGETLGQVPGSHNSSTGPGIGRPVVRGLTGNRVLVVADGQRLEFQQWGEEHAPSLEVQDAAAVEIVRGPASVLYGSDALGGVVNVIARPLPEAAPGASLTTGRAWLGYISNNEAPDASVALEGARGAFGWRAFLGGQRGGDLQMPGGALTNSGYGSWAGSAIAGLRGSWGRGQVAVAQKDERFEISEDPSVDPAYSGFQRVGTTRVRAEANVPFARHRVELAAGFERNRRREYGAATDTDVTTGLAADLYTLHARFLHAPLGRVEGAIGASASRLDFVASGTEPFLPDYGWWNAALYGFEQVRAGPALLALGLRVDHRQLDVSAAPALDVTAQALSWTALSGNVGASVRLTDEVSLVANLGRGFRAPQAPELFANGVHQGTLAYEIGDPGLGIERSWNVDAGVRLASGRVSGELNLFRNAVDGFIYYRPTGEREPRTGLEIFRFTQGQALLTGFEASLGWLVIPELMVTFGADMVRGRNQSLDVALPYMPPLRALYSVHYSGLTVPGVRGMVASLGLRGESMMAQSDPDPQEVAPPGFTRIDLEGGVAFPTRSGDVSVDLALRNVGNVHYTRPLNRFKTFAAERARHMVLRVGVPF